MGAVLCSATSPAEAVELERRGVDAVIAQGFEAGASHVQLAVVDGNAPAMSLYAKLGFRPFDTLRTILFA